MRRLLLTSLFALLAVAVGVTPGRADWYVRAPFVRVAGGQGVWVRAPFVDIRVGGYVPVAPLPIERMEPVSPATPPLPVRVQTLDEFATSFRPAAGNYEVTLQHSRTGTPVTVRFTLPAGEPKIRVSRHEIDFDYGREDVRIRCQIGGRIRVSYE